MYENFFNLKAKPFDLLPNPEFLFLSRSHKRAISYLEYGIRERVGFILLTGEVGSGKTTLIRNLLKKYNDQIVVSNVFNTKVNSDQLLAMINDDFGVQTGEASKVALLRSLNDFLIEQFVKGNHPVLIVDEAQNLTQELLEEIRMLSNLETESSKLLQIILVGQPELRATLSSPALVQLRQRISVNCHLKPLSRRETEEYIYHRLEKAGNKNAVTFGDGTIDVVHTYSRGIPRLINILCDFLLLSAFADETKTIAIEMVKDIVADLDFERHFWSSSGPGVSAPHVSDTEPTSPGGGISEVLHDLTDRIDGIESDRHSFNRSLLDEMALKMKALEETVATYQKETQRQLCPLPVPQVAMAPIQERNVPKVERKEGLFRRLFSFKH